VEWCHDRYRSYNERRDAYKGYDGLLASLHQSIRLIEAAGLPGKKKSRLSVSRDFCFPRSKMLERVIALGFDAAGFNELADLDHLFLRQ
jgi:hypothetical protein